MKNQTVLIIAYNRPNYLQILLDSIALVDGMEDWDLHLSIDGPQCVSRFRSVISKYPLSFMKWGDHVGISNHVIRSFEYLFGLGYKRILYVEEDFILRRDILSGWQDLQPDEVFLSMQSVSPHYSSHVLYSPLGNVIYSDQAPKLIDYYNLGLWHWKPWPTPIQPPIVLSPTMLDGYDAVFWTYLKDYNLKSRFRERSYAGHIGVTGTHFPGNKESLQLESEIFAGNPSNWLLNAARLFQKRSDYHGFVPKDFVYE